MKVHLAMIYGCIGKRVRRDVRIGCCRFEELVYCGIGVEGPPELRESGRYIASPFGGRPCPNCGGDTVHVRWNEDRHFDPPIEAPSGARVFTVPDIDKALKRLEREGGTVFLGEVVVIP